MRKKLAECTIARQIWTSFNKKDVFPTHIWWTPDQTAYSTVQRYFLCLMHCLHFLTIRRTSCLHFLPKGQAGITGTEFKCKVCKSLSILHSAGHSGFKVYESHKSSGPKQALSLSVSVILPTSSYQSCN